VKIDPYLNVDAGTMNPYQHGEVYVVLGDGGEVDLDLGNYERFLDIDMTSDHNITTGKTYQHVIEKERAGDYLGKTVQIIPTSPTTSSGGSARRPPKAPMSVSSKSAAPSGTSRACPTSRRFVSSPTRNPRRRPLHPRHARAVLENGEQKTKPTQHSVKEVRSIGLQPDVIVGRCEDRLDPETKEKIALFCDIPTDAVFSNPTSRTSITSR